MRLSRRVEHLEVAGATVTVHTDGVPIRLLFVTDDILRIRAGFDPGFEEASYSLVTTAWPDRLDGVVAGRTRVDPAPATLEDGPEVATFVGRRLRVEIEKNPFRLRVVDVDGTVLHADVADLGYREDPNSRRLHTSEIAPGDRFYGFGEATGPLDRAGRRISLSPSDALGYDAAHTDPLYKHIPFFVTLTANRVAVGSFYHGTYDAEFDLGRSRSNYWPPHRTYRTDGGDVDLFLIAGPSIRDVVRRYTDLTGRPALLPKAALGYLGSSMYYPELPAGADRAILDLVDVARREGIPLDGFQLSSGYTQAPTADGPRRCVFTWDRERFGDPAAFLAEMTRRGVTVSPNVKPGVLLAHPERDAMAAEGMFVRAADGEEPAIGAWWGGRGHMVDFTNPAARRAWATRLRRAVLDLGTSSVWNDNCEYDGLFDLDARCDGDGAGGTIAGLKNVMANLMCEVTRDAIADATPDARPYVVCRSGHAGIQRFAQTWSGDNRTSWETLRHNVPTMLGMSLSGVANHGSDVGGFAGPAPDAELFVRWVQHGVFQPRFSIHSANSDNTVTEPWMHEGHTHLVREAIRLRYRLFPYLYALMVRAHRDGLPIMEPLVSAFQHDPALDEVDDTFMLGDALLVAGVLEPGATSRRVRLPDAGTFYAFDTREPHPGGGWAEVPVDLASIPLFLAPGAILPLALDDLDNLATQEVTGLRLVCVPDRDGRITLVEDDGVTRAHERGDLRETRVTMRAGEIVEITLSRTGTYPSPIERLLFDVVHPAGAPVGVELDGRPLERHLDRERFAACETGWHWSAATRSVLVALPDPGGDLRLTISFARHDLIGM